MVRVLSFSRIQPRGLARDFLFWCSQGRNIVGRIAYTFVLAALVSLLFIKVGFADHVPTLSQQYQRDIQPLISKYCGDCHTAGEQEGGFDLDALSAEELSDDSAGAWYKVLVNLRAGVMPPSGCEQPSDEERAKIADWIKFGAIGINPKEIDPGRVTLRRLNRTEYSNTIRDLMGIHFVAEEVFPVDDSGYGFDNIGDVLTISPLLMEKYLEAARQIVDRAVPKTHRAVVVNRIQGEQFTGSGIPEPLLYSDRILAFMPSVNDHGLNLFFTQAADISKTHTIKTAGTYRLSSDFLVRGDFGFNPSRCRGTLFVNGEKAWQQNFAWGYEEPFRFDTELHLDPGEVTLRFLLEPVEPSEPIDEKKLGNNGKFVDLRLLGVDVAGPLAEEHWGNPQRYDLFFPKTSPPPREAHVERVRYAREVLETFASKAFRRPVDSSTLDLLVAIAEDSFSNPDKTFEQAVSEAFVAVLCSPRFLMHMENTAESSEPNDFPLLDEYTLASRLSYLLWSTMPDQELTDLASRGELRANLESQVDRLLLDEKAHEFASNFGLQWMPIRDLPDVPLNHRAVLRYEGSRKQIKFTRDLRRNMYAETELFVREVIQKDLSILNFIDSDFTFLNGPLAEFYEIEGVDGREMRRVDLPESSKRGGLVTQASVLTVTSDPNRTSPVKRGQFILSNFLGTPAPPPPPDIPQLEDSVEGENGRTLSVREAMQLHRADPMCASCHARMDPIGLAFENYNAIGMWRDEERGDEIDASGTLVTGESIDGIEDLKQIMLHEKRTDFYRCFTEKLMTYALGRAPEITDVHTVDTIVETLERDNGKFSTLLMGIIESTPFQRRRSATPSAESGKQHDLNRPNNRPQE